jgi:hypothetical protein
MIIALTLRILCRSYAGAGTLEASFWTNIECRTLIPACEHSHLGANFDPYVWKFAPGGEHTQRAVLKSSSSWELCKLQLEVNKFIAIKFAICKFSTWTRFKNHPQLFRRTKEWTEGLHPLRPTSPPRENRSPLWVNFTSRGELKKPAYIGTRMYKTFFCILHFLAMYRSQSYASVVNFYNATGNLACFENKNIIFHV